MLRIQLLLILYLFIKYSCGFLKKNEITYSEQISLPMNLNESGVYAMKKTKDQDVKYKTTDIYRLFKKGLAYYGKKVGLFEYVCGKIRRRYTFNELHVNALKLADALTTFQGGVPEKIYKEEANGGKFRLLGLYGNNSSHWVMTDIASIVSNVTTVVIHSRFTMHEIIYIINKTQLQWLCLTIDNMKKLIHRKDEIPHVKLFILLDQISEDKESEGKSSTWNSETKGETEARTDTTSFTVGEEKHKNNIDENFHLNEDCPSAAEMKRRANDIISLGKKVGLQIIHISDLLKSGNENPEKMEPFGFENHVTTIIYTSGSTGIPKGVMVTNGNLFHAIIPHKHVDLFEQTADNRHLCYLQLSHIFERENIWVALLLGKEIHFWSKNIEGFLRDLMTVRPDIVPGIPKIYKKMHYMILKKINSLPAMKRWFVKVLFKIRGSLGSRINRTLESIFKLSKTIRDNIDPNLEFMVNAGGKLNKDIHAGVELFLGRRIYQGYGMTETIGAVFVQSKKDKSYNNVGGPISPFLHFKLKNWENYRVNDIRPKGELLLKGPQVFSGYFLNKEITKEVFTEDGFFKTGDIVQINSNGSITFLDRSKSLMKISTGEYVQGDSLNALFSKLPFVLYCTVYADDELDKPIVILNVDAGILWNSIIKNKVVISDHVQNVLSKNKGIITEELLNSDEVIKYTALQLKNIFTTSKLAKHNMPGYLYISKEPWTHDNFITASLKVRTFKVIQHYKNFIDKVKKKKVNPI